MPKRDWTDTGIKVVFTTMLAGLAAWGDVASWHHWWMWPVGIVSGGVTALFALAILKGSNRT